MTGRHGGAVRGRLHRRLGNGDLTAVPEVRHALRDLLGKWPERAEDGTADAADVAELLASELVTNALIHTDQGAVVTATVEDSRLHVEVQDFMAGLPVRDVPTADLGTGGRGLVLVERLADAWGVRTAQGVGKVIWFELHAGAA
ncbi:MULTISPECIES: ATP-binding protein [unclassified Streptomyces]|jgi:anti-sigma regulatory factor (Ser/Thr protein kinase)|uniref:ATP-binding protein n=1 Tax=unclassified Streptomyces TaxID=2593676 RepID=UPI0027891795|nr:ATP-binding protein [Streptomyces sp. V1I6]MDQ0845963.1 anti-sigma regulatory factor (Ser/Thr protein kinase) [Streptomyces sp. V1I6]